MQRHLDDSLQMRSKGDVRQNREKARASSSKPKIAGIAKRFVWRRYSLGNTDQLKTLKMSVVAVLSILFVS
jgi:hypothetical protein